jgi:hypothetical protein
MGRSLLRLAFLDPFRQGWIGGFSMRKMMSGSDTLMDCVGRDQLVCLKVGFGQYRGFNLVCLRIGI